jgi:hypothetical protein
MKKMKSQKNIEKCRRYRQSESGSRIRRLYAKKYRNTEIGRKSRLSAQRKYEKAHYNKEKHLAVAAVYNAIKNKELKPVKKCKCFCCGKKAEQYHHHKSYKKKNRLKVKPVCRPCHRTLHGLPTWN